MAEDTLASGSEPEPPMFGIIRLALAAPAGEERIRQAADYLRALAQAGKFNTQRAIEVYTIAADNSVRAYVAGSTIQRLLYADYKDGGYGPVIGRMLADEFKRLSGVTDQRKPRKWLRGILGS